MIADLATDPRLYVIAACVVAVLVLAHRVPIFGTLLRLATTVAIVALLVLVAAERGRFDPYLGRITQLLDLDDQQVSGKEVRIRMSPDGHFWARARVGGVDRRMLIDSGATVTALSTDTAARAGLTVSDPLFPLVLHTANGAVSAQTANVAELQLGTIVARDLAVVVSPAFGDSDVLGMNFLSRLKSWRVEGTTLVLVPHHPQPVDSAASTHGA